MNVITIDFETYYDKEYSLSKLTTEEYVRDDRFEVIGVGVKTHDSETKWFSGNAEQTKAFLDSFDMENNLVLAHNAMFDAAILTWHFGIRPSGWLDTLSMARAIHSTEVGGSLAALALLANGTDRIGGPARNAIDLCVANHKRRTDHELMAIATVRLPGCAV